MKPIITYLNYSILKKAKSIIWINDIFRIYFIFFSIFI